MKPQPSPAHSNCPSSPGPQPSPLTPAGLAVEPFAAAAAQAVRRVEALAQALRRRRDTFRNCLAEAVALNAAQPGLYRMDVGGTPFHTHEEVLHRHGGMLSVMASDKFPGSSDEGGWSFLDRDPRWFPLVLQFLRTGEAWVPDEDEGRAAVCCEARYYSLEVLCQVAQPRRRVVAIVHRGCRYGWQCTAADL